MRIFTLVHWTFGFFATPARTKDQVRLNSRTLQKLKNFFRNVYLLCDISFEIKKILDNFCQNKKITEEYFTRFCNTIFLNSQTCLKTSKLFSFQKRFLCNITFFCY